MRDREGPSIDLIDVHKSYEEGERTHEVLTGASVTIPAGQRVAILGPSGSGKSTLLNLMSGIDLPDSGTVRIGDTDLGRLSERDRTLFRRDHIGFVFQFFNLLPTLTVLENLLLPLELSGRANGVRAGRGVDGSGVGAEEQARALLDAVELGARADAFPDRLSGGEQQRVAIARSLVHEPDLLLADEPTGNLDEDTGDRVIEVLESLVAAGRTTLVVVTHSRELAGRMDRILELDHGRLRDG
ncbi:MAG: ABC transporter ATP-binding protein [Gemmatimonadetes bacterium]|nr:ABC transporter ATP-binding protein [Gemmatimonadota bacterium]NNF13141.1 ABC transporter ATP-binding protein [Gemmatimonadota bacterium]